jgi:hypothetical protein
VDVVWRFAPCPCNLNDFYKSAIEKLYELHGHLRRLVSRTLTRVQRKGHF